MAVDKKYIDQATSQLTPTHNSQVTSLKNQLAQNQLALDQQKNSVNANYDLNVQNQNLNNRLNKNTISNAMIGRGLSNSSIAISGLAEQDAKNARVQADIERNRVNDLGNIDANKALLEQNTNNTIGQMDRDLQDKILALAMQLEDRQWEKDFKDKGYQLQLDQFNYDKLYKDQQLQFSKDQFEYDKLYKDQQLQMQQQAQTYDQQYKDKLFEQSQQAQMFDQQYKNQTLELQKQAQAYEQQYKDITLKMEQEKMKFDMGYQNEYLAMQKEAQQAEIAYKNSMLALQQQQAQADSSFKWAQLQWEKDKFGAQQQAQNNSKYDSIKSTVDNVMVDPSISSSDKYNALTQLYYSNAGDSSMQDYIMSSYQRLMNQNNTGSSARSLTSTSQNLYSGISQEEARKKIGYEYNPAYDFITNRR